MPVKQAESAVTQDSDSQLVTFLLLAPFGPTDQPFLGVSDFSISPWRGRVFPFDHLNGVDRIRVSLDDINH